MKHKLRIVESLPEYAKEFLADLMLRSHAARKSFGESDWFWFKVNGKLFAYRPETSPKWFAEVSER